MNERIRELAEQAGYAPLKPRTFADDLQDIFLQKFAELIVKECAKVAFYDWYDGTNEGSSKMAILKHFGVAE